MTDRENEDRLREPLDPFEQEIRRALHSGWSEPASEEFAARIAAIPLTARRTTISVSRVGSWLGGHVGTSAVARFGLGLAGVAAAAVIIAAGSILVSAINIAPGFGSHAPGPANGSSSPVALGQTAGPASPSLGPTATPTPSTPSPIGGPIGAAVPPDFVSAMGTFVNADLGWLLGSTTCNTSPCAAIVRTNDGGTTWVGIPAPATAFVAAGSGNTGVGGLRFADPMNGWAFGPDLWATHDGGATWHRVTIPGTSGQVQVMTFDAAGGTAHVVYYDGGTAGRLAIATSPVGTDDWVTSATSVALGAGPVPHPQLVLRGSEGWLIEVDRTVVAGARLAAGSWSSWQPPCKSANGPALVAASSLSDLTAACDVGQWSTPAGVHLYVSSDSGATFAAVGPTVPVSGIAAIAAPATGVALVAGGRPDGTSVIVGTFDGGATWTPVLTFPAAGSVDLLFPTTSEGFAIVSSADGPSRLFSTGDGGRSWSAMSIAGG